MNSKTNIVLKAKSGERTAFEQLYVETKDKIYFLCLKFLKNEADALDIVSDTYLTVIEKLDTLEQPEYFETWLNKIAVNKCKNHLAKSKAVLFSEQDDMERYAEELPEVNKEFIPESYVADKEKREQVMAIIDNELSDVQRSVILMYYYSEIGVREIAEELDCSEGTVKSRLNSARKIIYKYVTDMQKKGEVLFSVGSIPLLSLLLQEAAKEYTVSEAQSAIILQQCLTKYDKVFMSGGKAPMEQVGNGIEQAGNMSGKIVEQGAIGMAKKTIITKIAVVIAGVAVVGATVAGIIISNKNHNNQSETAMNQNHVVVTEETETTAVKEASTEDDASIKKDVYILPESNTRYIKSNEITDFDTEKLNLAKNEIYARHGLIFNTDSIKKYFENCTWYKPSVDSSEFSDSVFNEYEVANIALLEDYEKFSVYTYPLEVKNGESVKVDLNGDGELEKVSFSVKEREPNATTGGNAIVIKINDSVEKFEDEGYGFPQLFVTDINQNDNKKEICVQSPYANEFIDYIFYSYSLDRKIKQTEYLSGYDIQYLNDGTVLCMGRTMGTVTMLFVYFEYKYIGEHFEYVDRVYEFPQDVNSWFHEKDEVILTLKKEIKVYKDCSKSSETFTIKPQKLKITAVYLPNQEDYENVWTRVELEDKSTGWIYGNYGGDETIPYENEYFKGIHFAG